MALDEREVIRDMGLLVRSLVVLVARDGRVRRCTPRCTWSRLSSRCSEPASWSRSPGSSRREFLEEVEWSTLVFFMGLFVMVGALVEVGVIESLGEAGDRGGR